MVPSGLSSNTFPSPADELEGVGEAVAEGTVYESEWRESDGAAAVRLDGAKTWLMVRIEDW